MPRSRDQVALVIADIVFDHQSRVEFPTPGLRSGTDPGNRNGAHDALLNLVGELLVQLVELAGRLCMIEAGLDD